MSGERANAPTAGPGDRVGALVFDPLIVAGVVLLGALLGIALRPHGLLSAFWPANAILLGLLVRRPRLATPIAWIAAALAYLAADLATGSSLLKAALLTACNMAGVGVGFALLIRLHPEDLALKRPAAVISVTLAMAVASLAAGAMGAIAHPVLFNAPAAIGFAFWTATELSSYMVILPVLLTLTGFRPPADWLGGAHTLKARLIFAAPLCAYVVTLAIVPLVGGPGALTFPIPALIWCALVYGLTATAILNLTFAAWALLVVGGHAAFFGLVLNTPLEMISLRLGVMLDTLGPITVASVMAARSALLQEARFARKAAEDAMEARSLLLATMAHELRSPLTSVVGFSNRMARQSLGPLGNPRYVDYAQSIEMAGSHLSSLVTDLLDTAKLEAGQTELSPARVGSRDVVDQSLRLVRGLALEADVPIEVAPGDWPDVWADGRAVKQVLINLLSNAIKFSSAGAVVTVSTVLDEGRLVICVKDRGVGISPADLATIGRAYAQAGAPDAQRKGTGLGLALSRELVQRHGGRLRIESALGAGASVAFDLPLAGDTAA